MPRGPKAKLYRYLGEAFSLKDWAEIAKIPYTVLKQRIQYGWKLSDALTCKVGERPPEHLKALSAKMRRINRAVPPA